MYGAISALFFPRMDSSFLLALVVRSSRRLVASVRDLKLSWNIARFVYLEEVFATIRRFPQVQSVDFCCNPLEKILWAPIELHGWPISLVSLGENFLASFSLFMASEGLGDVLPKLEVLDLTEDVKFSVDSRNTINFKRLSAGLRVLRLTSTESCVVSVSHLKELPLHLSEVQTAIPVRRSLAERRSQYSFHSQRDAPLAAFFHHYIGADVPPCFNVAYRLGSTPPSASNTRTRYISNDRRRTL